MISVTAFAALCLSGCASTASGADAASFDTIAGRAGVVGIASDLVYTTEVDGYDLQPQSVGPGAADGLSATWFNVTTGTMFTLRSDRGEMTEDSCASTPLWDGSTQAVACTEEDGVWHRTDGSVHEYVAVRGAALVLVTGMNDAPPADLLAAAQAVRVPSEAELKRLFSDLPTVSPEPVERGDLPENGDGAPIDPVGPGG